MREIKFRAWDEANKKMHTNVFFLKTGDAGNDWIVFSSDQQRHKVEDNKLIFDNPYFSQQIKLMQFTGLKDKNGKDIYEGDIVKYWGGVNPVVFHRCGFFIQYGKDDFFPLLYENVLLTVIGNIYENPEYAK